MGNGGSSKHRYRPRQQYVCHRFLSGPLDVPNGSSGNSFLVTLVLTEDPGDLNGDGEVTSADIQILTSSFGCTLCPNLDLNGDGIVTVADLLLYQDLIDG
jgi:hypothetical protein